MASVLALLVVFIPGCASLLPPTLHAINRDVEYRIPGPKRTLYLTFDDGPSSSTAEILRVLGKYGVHATFFIVSDHISAEAMGQIVSGGHALGHHMKTTKGLGGMSAGQFESEFREAEKRIGEFGAIVAFRPPDGAIDHAKAQLVKDSGYPIIAGTIYPLDHMLMDERTIERLACFLVVDGGIIILHDTNSRGMRTAKVLDKLIPHMKRKGYRFELLPLRKVEAGS